MSRIGKKIIELPAGVTAEINASTNVVTVKGKLGELKETFLSFIHITLEGSTLAVTVKNETDRLQKAMWGTARALINNMVVGVSEGFNKEVELNGVGFKMELAGQNLTIYIGYSHPVKIVVPQEIKLTLNKNVLTGTSIHKQIIGDFFMSLHNMKPSDPYKQKGFKIPGKHYQKKVGKKLAK